MRQRGGALTGRRTPAALSASRAGLDVNPLEEAGPRGSIDTMDEVRSALEKLRDLQDAELDRLCRRHDVRVLTVFGSAADPSVAAPNDLDVGVLFEPGSAHDVLGLFGTLVSALGTERLDVLDAERATETARYRAIVDGVPLYESEPTAFANAYAAAVMLYLDTARFRDEALANVQP